MKYLSLKILSLLSLILAVVAIYFRHAEVMTLYAIFKPLTTISIIIIAALIYREFRTNYSAWIILALLFSLIGDVFLIGNNYFLYGLAAFFLAHITFIIAFTRIHGFLRNGKVFAFLALIGTSYFYLLYENLGVFIIPVLIYMSVLLVMNWQVISLAFVEKTKLFLMLAIASLFFSFSDSIIAYSKFIGSFAYSEILILSTYWLAIYCFAISGIWIADLKPHSNLLNHHSNKNAHQD